MICFRLAGYPFLVKKIEGQKLTVGFSDGWGDGHHIRMVDSRFHIQVHCTDILNTDNYGYVYLKAGKGNVIFCFGSVSY